MTTIPNFVNIKTKKNLKKPKKQKKITKFANRGVFCRCIERHTEESPGCIEQRTRENEQAAKFGQCNRKQPHQNKLLVQG